MMVECIIRKPQGRSTVRVWQSQPRSSTEKQLGSAFALIDIENQQSINDHIIDIIIDDFQRYYYRSATLDIEGSFENALHKLNRRLQELIGEVGEDWIHETTAVLGVWHDREMVCSSIGRATGFMVYKDKIIDVLDTAGNKAQTINPVKVFSGTIGGRLVDDAAIFFGTESILDYLSKDRIRRLLDTDKPADITGQLATLLGQDTQDTNFAALILSHSLVDDQPVLQRTTIIDENEPTEVVNGQPSISAEAETSSTPAERSMRQLFHQQASTQDMLAPAWWPKIKDMVRQRLQRFGQSTQKSTFQPNAEYSEQILTPTHSNQPVLADDRWKIILKDVAKRLGRESKRAWQATQRGTKKAWDWSYQQYQRYQAKRAIAAEGDRAPVSPSPVRRTSALRPESTTSKISVPMWKQWLEKLSTIQKIFIVLALIALIVFIGALLREDNNQTTTNNEQVASSTMADVDLKVNEGKAAMVYDEKEARRLFSEAQTLLNQIPKDSAIYQQRHSQIEQTINEQLAALNKVKLINDTTPLLDFGSTVGSAEISSLVKLGNGLFVFDRNSQQTWRGDQETKAISTTIETTSEPGVYDAVTYSPGTALLARRDGTSGVLDPTTDTVTALEFADNKLTDSTPITTFGNRLYSLAVDKNQIYRFDITDSSVSEPTQWIADDSVKLDNAVGLAIDGSIYVLKKSGIVIKLSGGTQDDWKLETIEPALTSADWIYTNESIDLIYIADFTGKRIVVFNKEGKLQGQFQFTGIESMTDLIIDADEATAYILDNNKIYQSSVKIEEKAEN